MDARRLQFRARGRARNVRETAERAAITLVSARTARTAHLIAEQKARTIRAALR